MSIETFRALYDRVGWDAPADLETFLLDEGLAASRRLMVPLMRYRHFSDAPSPVSDDQVWQLWGLYALSRVSDYLLLAFQPGDPCPEEVRRMTERTGLRVHTEINLVVGTPEWERFTSSSEPWPGTERVAQPQPPCLSQQTYIRFFEGLGFASFGDERPYSPFSHELFEVIENPSHNGGIVIDEVVWPGLSFGELLFSRAGVRVRCLPGVLDKESAERSTLYFAFRRRRRKTDDPSVDWGHNSQWKTELYRFYDDGTHYHFNVDGKIDLGANDLSGVEQNSNSKLMLAQRRELLVHRCVVTGWEPRDDLWPYDDTWMVEKGHAPWPT
ncbi:MAG: hypothetical protein ACJ789_09850 [Thermomicrobiales bacterium]